MNPLAERIVDLFMPETEDLKCTFPKFCYILAHFQPTSENTPEEMPNSGYSKAKLVFLLFDANNSGKISKAEILDVLRYMVGANIGGENLRFD